MLAGENPEAAARREAQEEVGVTPANLHVVRRDVNSYGRYCYLLTGQTDEQPTSKLDPREVAWATYASIEELHAKKESGELTFVNDFFEDLEFALATLK
jgi:ADP-ribose pyrophosphatase YjhB (NUDIX family)